MCVCVGKGKREKERKRERRGNRETDRDTGLQPDKLRDTDKKRKESECQGQTGKLAVG